MSFPRYPKYKESGVDWLEEVPEHWKISRIKEVFSERNERSKNGDETLLSVSAYTGVTPRSEVIDEGDHLSRAESLEGYKVCYPNDLVMNIMLAWNRGLGVSQQHGIVSPAYSVFSVVDKSVPKFLDYLVRSDEYTGYFKAFSTGVIDSRLRLYPDVFRFLSIALPDTKEQREIAAFLDRETAKIDALVAEQRRLIELLKEKRQAVISHAVTKGLNPHAKLKPSGIEWLGDVPEHWEVMSVGQRYEIRVGKMLDSAKITGDHLKPYLRVADVQWGTINVEELPEMDFAPDAQQKFRLVEGDLLVNEGGSYVGRAAIWRGQLGECYYQKALHRMRPLNYETDSSEFFFFVMIFATQYGVFVAGGNHNTIEHLPAEALRKYKFAFPPLLEQLDVSNALAKETSEIDTLVSEAERAIDLLQERRTALISSAVTGKIDVRGLAPTEAA